MKRILVHAFIVLAPWIILMQITIKFRLQIEPWLLIVPAWGWVIFVNVANAMDIFTTKLFLRGQKDFKRESNPVARFMFEKLGFRVSCLIKVMLINFLVLVYWRDHDFFIIMFCINIFFVSVSLFNYLINQHFKSGA